MGGRSPAPAERHAVEPIGTALVSIGEGLVKAPLLRTTVLGEALVRLTDRDRWVPLEWWTRA